MAVPNVFSSGVLAMSADVNENFAAIDEASQFGLAAGARHRAKFSLPDEIPCYGVPARANLTAVSLFTPIAIDNRVYWVIDAGTTGAAPPTATKSNYIVDGSAVLAYIGYLAPVAYANNLALVLDQLFVANGRVYRVTVAGTTSGAGSGPTLPTGGTDGTVDYAYVSEQTMPIVTEAGSAPGGTTEQVAWDSAKMTKLGGTFVQIGANPRGALFSASPDGNAYTTGSGGGGVFATVTDAPLWAFAYFNRAQALCFVDGQLAAYVYNQTAAGRYITFDSRGMVRKAREYRIDVDQQTQFFGCYATGADSFDAYVPKNGRKAVIITDSFGGYHPFGYTNRLGHQLGIEDWRIASMGGTGVLWTGGLVNYGGRFTVDVINHNPDYVIIQLTQNDRQGVIAGTFTEAQVKAATGALIDRCRNEIPNAQVLLMPVWNNRGALTGIELTLYNDAVALAAEKNVPLIDWSAFSTDGGFAGSLSGSGNSGQYIAGDGTHPTYHGHWNRADRLEPLFAPHLDGNA